MSNRIFNDEILTEQGFSVQNPWIGLSFDIDLNLPKIVVHLKAFASEEAYRDGKSPIKNLGQFQVPENLVLRWSTEVQPEARISDTLKILSWQALDDLSEKNPQQTNASGEVVGPSALEIVNVYKKTSEV